MNPTQKTVTQTVAKAAAKTFAQAFLSTLVVTLLPILSKIQEDLSDGGTFDVANLSLVGSVVLAAVVAGIAALISMAWNWSKTTQ